MKFNLNQISTEGVRLAGQVAASSLDLGCKDIQVLEPVSYILNIGLSKDGAWAAGTLNTTLHLNCVCCCEFFPFEVNVQNFAVLQENSGSNDLDITEAARDEILLSLPAYPHCDWNQQRVCPGKEWIEERNRNVPEQDNKVQAVRWAALDQLKF